MTSEAATAIDGAVQVAEASGGRYRVESVLGRGGFGVVFAGRDTATGERVAIKRVHQSGAGDTHAREAAALRLLRIQGVARLLDEFESGEAAYFVMELVDGRPFPGESAMGPSWTALEPLLRRLLAILARVHAEGFVHLDLKPQNVLVGPDGRVVVLDFGVSVGRPFAPWDARERGQHGTLAYAAPEQLLGGQKDARSDLYAVGAMVLEALTGQAPFAGALGSDDYVALRTAARPPIELPAETDPAAERFLAAVLAPSPEDRPRCANEAARLLGGATREAVELRDLVRASGGSTTAGPLRALFAGPDVLFHVREDAAALLFERTAGDPSRIEAELEVWIDSGLASWSAGRIAL
ncbi:MAG: serine/threonine-protein kinase, partial [Planctomycetota bacterium]